MLSFTVTSAEASVRLDVFLASKMELPRAKVQKYIADGLVLVDSTLPTKSGLLLKEDMKISVTLPIETPLEVVPYDFPLDIIYEDDDFLVVDKPAGLVVHPAPGHTDDTLVNALKARYGDLPTGGPSERAGIVHRLDMDTSGLILIAKTEESLATLSEIFQKREIDKHYLALVNGRPTHSSGRIEAPIGRDPKNRQRMTVRESGREAVTEYTIKENYKNHTLLDVKLLTGRTHQIRVHLAAIGHPVYADPLYGRAEKELDRQFLHAYALSFTHPKTGQKMNFSSPLPTDLSEILHKLSL